MLVFGHDRAYQKIKSLLGRISIHDFEYYIPIDLPFSPDFRPRSDGYIEPKNVFVAFFSGSL